MNICCTTFIIKNNWVIPIWSSCYYFSSRIIHKVSSSYSSTIIRWKPSLSIISRISNSYIWIISIIWYWLRILSLFSSIWIKKHCITPATIIFHLNYWCFVWFYINISTSYRWCTIFNTTIFSYCKLILFIWKFYTFFRWIICSINFITEFYIFTRC